MNEGLNFEIEMKGSQRKVQHWVYHCFGPRALDSMRLLRGFMDYISELPRGWKEHLKPGSRVVPQASVLYPCLLHCMYECPWLPTGPLWQGGKEAPKTENEKNGHGLFYSQSSWVRILALSSVVNLASYLTSLCLHVSVWKVGWE